MTLDRINLLLVDEDPVFRLGLRIWLEQRPEFRVVAEATTATETLQQLQDLQTVAQAVQADAGESLEPPPERPGVDLVVLDLGLGQGNPEELPGLQLCGEIKRRFPALPVLVLCTQAEPVLQAAAQQMGADGFGLRGLPVRELARLISHVAAPVGMPLNRPAPSATVAPLGPVTALRQSCLQQIDAAIAAVNTEQAQPLSLWYGAVLNGKQRELKAARWLIQRILPKAAGRSQRGGNGAIVPPVAAAVAPLSAPGGALVSRPSALAFSQVSARTRVCEAVFRKLQFPLENHSSQPLEIDILRSERLRELLYTTLRVFEDLLDDLQKAQILPGQLAEKAPNVVQDLWKTTATDFFGRYYTLQDASLEQPLVEVLIQDAEAVQQGILRHIPEVPALLEHLLFQGAMQVDGTAYVATTPEALRRSQTLLENLLIQTTCAVIQPLLNRFADVEGLKRTLYQRRIVSSRDIARFRNDLAWRYRWDSLVNEPKAIFESQYRLFTLTPQGIQTQWIYAPRREELDALSGAQYALTLALEARDALAPRLRSTISWLGSGLVYVLTEVVGRGIGLVGRGILKGIGSAWQDNRLPRQPKDEIE